MGLRVLVTGGAGFIGSHLVDALMRSEYEVRIIDNLSQGRVENISNWIGKPGFEFIEGDVTDEATMREAVKSCSAIFHLAANPEVRLGDPRTHYRENVYATYVILEAMRANDVKKIVFTSSSTVYGEARIIPTPEDYCVEAIMRSFDNIDRGVEVHNVGSEDAINVKTIAGIVIEELGLKDVEIIYTGGIEGRGWKGDVGRMLLDISKIKNLGWKPRHNSAESVRLAARALKEEL